MAEKYTRHYCCQVCGHELFAGFGLPCECNYRMEYCCEHCKKIFFTAKAVKKCCATDEQRAANAKVLVEQEARRKEFVAQYARQRRAAEAGA